MWSVRSDYGLQTYRRDGGAEPLSSYQQRLLEVYMPPEFHNSNMEPTLAGDVFRYQTQSDTDLHYLTWRLNLTTKPGLFCPQIHEQSLINNRCMFSSYSIILLEIATRSDPVPVSHSLIG